MNHPPLFLTVSDAILWLAAQPKAPRSPALRALWIGAAVSGGALTSNEVIAAARLTELLDGIKVTDSNLTHKLPILARCGLFKRVRPDTYSPTTTACNGAKVGKRYLYVATKEVRATTGESLRLLPDRFVVVFPAYPTSPCLYVRENDTWVLKGYPDLPGPRAHDQAISLQAVQHAFRNPKNTVFTPRSTGNHYDA